MGSQVQTALLFETTTEIYQRVFRELKPRSALPEIGISFRRYANANSFIRLENGRLEVKISDALEGAPAPVQEALAQILLGKLYRRPVAAYWQDRYRRYLNRADMRRTLHLLRQERAAEAESLYVGLAAEHPGEAEYLVGLGVARAQGRDFPAAIAALEQAAARAPRDAGIQAHLATTLLTARDPQKAAAMAERVIAADPWNEAGYRLLASALLDRGDRSGARRVVAHLDQVLAELGVAAGPGTEQLRIRCREGD